jgi:hypothetical protein
MAYPDNIEAEILRAARGGWVQSIERGFYLAAEALAGGRFIIRNTSLKWEVTLAALLVKQMSSADDPLWKEARSLELLSRFRWFPVSTRSVLSRRRKQWRKEERAKTKDQGPA